MAQNAGKRFEEDFKKSVPSDIYFFRIKDPPSSFGQDSKATRFSLKNEFDAFIYCYPNLFPVELKSTKGTSFSFDGSSPMIKQNQIDELSKAANYKGIIPGFIFNMRKYNTTYFLHINDFNKCIEKISKKSINQKDIAEYGGIEVVGELKRTRYRYYVGEFIKRIGGTYDEG